MFYLINLLILIIYYFIIVGRDTQSQNKRKRFAIIACIHIVLFRGFSDPFDYVDADNYLMTFDYIKDSSFFEAIININMFTHMGQGYLFLNWIVSRFTDSYFVFTFVCSLVGVIPVVWFYYKSGQKLLFPLLVYLTYPMMFYQGFGVLRQHLSVAIILLVLYYLGRPKYSIPLALVACLMHTSGIVILPFLFFHRIKLTTLLNVKGILLSLIFLFLFRYFMWSILSLMPKYMEIVSEVSDNNIAPVAWMGAILFMFLLDHKRNLEWTDLEKKIMSFFLYGFVISICCLGLSGMGRFTICFYYVIPLVSMMIIKRTQSGAIAFSVYAINVVITLIMLYYSVPVHNYNYKFFWE